MKRCRKKKACVRCGTISANYKYCSTECQHLHIWEQLKNTALKTGKFLTWKNAKRYLLETYGQKCVICDLDEWNGRPIPIGIDHIDGNHQDHSLTNVRLICPNCDAQTDTYKGRNRGNGRHARRERYQKGLSY